MKRLQKVRFDNQPDNSISSTSVTFFVLIYQETDLYYLQHSGKHPYSLRLKLAKGILSLFIIGYVWNLRRQTLEYFLKAFWSFQKDYFVILHRFCVIKQCIFFYYNLKKVCCIGFRIQLFCTVLPFSCFYFCMLFSFPAHF